MQTKFIERYFFFGLLFITLIFTFFIFRPFWIVLVLGASLSAILYPIYEWLRRKKLPSWLSSFLTVFLLTILILGPILGIGVLVFNQSQNVYSFIANSGNTGNFITSLESKINLLLPNNMTINTNEIGSSFISFISGNIAQIFKSTLTTFFSFILLLLTIFYFLKDGEKWKKFFILLSPLKDADDHKIIDQLRKTISSVFNGYLFIALIQGLLMGLGLVIFGVPNAALWGVVAGIASLIPTFGTAFVSIPAIIFLYVSGNAVGSIGLLVWSIALVGMIDNFLSPLIVGRRINIPEIVILFAVLGGIALLGPVGILIGPIVVSLLYTLITMYRNEFQQN
ncbi:MAG: AI-2E family transporter [bacterium]